MILELSSTPRNTEATTTDWFSLAELAELDLPGLGDDRRKIARRARDERWDVREDAEGEPLARARAGRGGGTEFHYLALPGTAQLELAARGLLATRLTPAEADPEAASNAQWQWFDAQNEKTKVEARRRLDLLTQLEVLEQSGLTRDAAIAALGVQHDVKRSTVYEWIKRIEGVSRHHWLAYLAPARRGGGAEAEIPEDLWTVFLSDYLRPEQPTLASCYHRVSKIAAKQGVKLPTEATFRRRLKRDVEANVQRLRRGLKDEFKRSMPDQRRTVEGMAALDLVNVDGHVFDVWVEHPEGLRDKHGNVVRVRPMLIAIQDVYSRKMLAWRLDLSENYLATRLAFADLFRNFGIPNACLLDNSRTFAGKKLTGGATSRFRGKVVEGEAYGLLSSLGIQIRFAQVYHGQAKPIERYFRDVADHIARGPACAGAYAGNSILGKPTNVGERAVPWDTFAQIVDEGIADLNAREGRRGGVCNGRSYDQVFADSYATTVIRKAAPEQLRIALLDAEQKRINGRSGEISLLGNRYWSPECSNYPGEKVIVRYDPENLLLPVHVYSLDSKYLFAAHVWENVQFTDAKGSHQVKKHRTEFTRRVKEAEAALKLVDAAEVAALQASVGAEPLPAPAAVRPVRHRNVVAKADATPVASASKQSETKLFANLERAMALRLVE